MSNKPHQQEYIVRFVGGKTAIEELFIEMVHQVSFSEKIKIHHVDRTKRSVLLRAGFDSKQETSNQGDPIGLESIYQPSTGAFAGDF